MKVTIEWKLADLWVGAFWKRSAGVLHLWICLLPCFPIHFQIRQESIMQAYPDPHEYFTQQIHQAAQRYVDGLERAGLPANPTLTRAVAERAVQQAEAGYREHLVSTRDTRISAILHAHHCRLDALKREGASLRLNVCLPIAITSGLLAWYSGAHPHGFEAGASLMYALGAGAFLAIVVLGAIFDRPSS